jgi:hypothetical protein
MKTFVVILAGALFVSTAFASDPYAEERFKAKYGRYTPAEEARREALKKPAKAQSAALEAEVAMCEMPGCCKPGAAAKSEVSAGDAHIDALFRAKFGRPSPVEEARIAEAKREPAVSARAVTSPRCDRNCCDRGE